MTPHGTVIERLVKLQDVLAAGRATDRATPAGSILTAERRAKIEQEMRDAIVAASDVVDSLARDGMDLDPGRLAGVSARLNAVVHERDGLMKAADHARVEHEALSEVIELYHRTSAHLPIIGLTCDGDGCMEAVGIVGVKVVDLDAIAPALLTIAQAAGWVTYDRAADGDFQAVTCHLCRACASEARPDVG